MNKFIGFCNALLSAIYPNKCVCCGTIIEEGNFICDKCANEIDRVELSNVCFACGFEEDQCVCKYNVFRFNSSVSVFKNDGIAKEAYYSYKFRKRQPYAKFFATEVCDVVKKCYNDINFDLVCSVPGFQKHGFDHSGYIARDAAKQLNLYYDRELLRCVKRTKKQHKSTIKERLNNVDGKYCATRKVNGANILLIDDIKTTGATLDECARTLLFAGANSVHCVTVLSGAVSVEK